MRSSQFGGGIPVGGTQLMPDLGPVVTLADSSVWLRSGVGGAVASYPRLGAISAMRLFGRQSALNAGAATLVANGWAAANGAGAVVMPSDANGQMLYSTDHGNTWAAATLPGATGRPYPVAFGNGRFVTLAANGAALLFYFSSNGGATWTASSSTGLAASGFVTMANGPMSIGAVFTGTRFVFLMTTSGQNYATVATTVDGSSGGLGNNTNLIGAGSQYYTRIAADQSGNVVQWAWQHNVTNNAAYSTDHGATWANVAVVPGYTTPHFAVVGGAVYMHASGTPTSSLFFPNMAAFAANAPAAASPALGAPLTSVGGRAWAVCSPNTLTEFDSSGQGLSTVGTVSAAVSPLTGGGFVAASAGGRLTYSPDTTTSFDYVGVGAASRTNSLIAYVRAK